MTLKERNYYLEGIPLADARARLLNALREVGRDTPLAGEMVSLPDALGRVTAKPIMARLSSPHYHAAAMDGYAVLADDTLNATETRPLTLSPAQAVAVNTGAPLPTGKNAVIMIEHVQHDGDAIVINAPVPPYQHVRMMGEDMVATELVLPTNHRIRPVDLGAIAGAGWHEVCVRCQPHVVLIPTGNELVSIHQTPEPGQIIEYNSLVLSGQIRESGGRATVLAIQPDDRERLAQAVKEALTLTPDLILVLSGSSAGAKDFTAAIVRDLGQLLVHGVAVRPGHPVIMGMVDATPVIGVPGYPVSAALTGEIFIQPLIAGWLGQTPDIETRPRVRALTTRKVASSVGDDDFQRVTLAEVDGRTLATPLSRGAGVITSLVRADGLAHIPRFHEGVDAGAELNVIAYRVQDVLSRSLLALGSHDPMLDLLAQHLALDFPGYRLTSVNVGSMGGLVALKRGEAHFAGVHLLDETTGEYNAPAVRKFLPAEPLLGITFAHREQGLMVASGNPHAITGLADLPRLRYVNRQRGAGTRLLLDFELTKRGISPAQIQGYDREEFTHLAVAVAVKTGIADAGLGVRNAADALGLDFIPVGWERYDLIIPRRHAASPRGEAMLKTLQSEAFRHALSQQVGYDTTETGHLQFEQ